MKCPLKNQDKQQQDERCESNQGTAEKHESHREDWKKAQDQPQFSNPDNRCLNCTGNHRTRDCLMRQQHQAPPINHPVNGQGIYNSPSHFTHQSPQQQLQQSQSTSRSSMPMLMVNNPQYRQNFQGQNHRQQTPPIQHLNQQVRPLNIINIRCHKPVYFWYNHSITQTFHPHIQANGNNRPCPFSQITLIIRVMLVRYYRNNGNISNS